MTPPDDRSRSRPRSGDLGSVVDFAKALAVAQGAPEPTGYMPQLAGTAFAGSPSPLVEPRKPVGLPRTAVQLAHALEALDRLSPVSDHHGSPDPSETKSAQCPGAAPRTDEHQCEASTSEARRLVALALSSLAASADLGVPRSTLAGTAPEETLDPELEAVFVEFDTACEGRNCLAASSETWKAREEVDRYIVAEHAVLNLTDARPEVLRRQADLLLRLTDEISDQLGGATANAVANVAQGLLRHLDA